MLEDITYVITAMYLMTTLFELVYSFLSIFLGYLKELSDISIKKSFKLDIFPYIYI